MITYKILHIPTGEYLVLSKAKLQSKTPDLCYLYWEDNNKCAHRDDVCDSLNCPWYNEPDLHSAEFIVEEIQ